MSRRSGRRGKRTTARELRVAGSAPMPLRPSDTPYENPRPAPPAGRRQKFPSLGGVESMFLRNYVLETTRLQSARPHGRGTSRALTNLTRTVEEISGWESFLMRVQPN